MLSTFLDGGDDCRFSGLELHDFSAQSRIAPHSHKFAESAQLRLERARLSVPLDIKNAPMLVGAMGGILHQCEFQDGSFGPFDGVGELSKVLHVLVLMSVRPFRISKAMF